MLDVFHTPTASPSDVQLFTRPTTVIDQQYQMWVKPRGCAMVYMHCIAGGGGGGGGHSAAAASARGGGGAGGSSGIVRLMMPAIFLPDTLFVHVGAGGPGGAATVAGTAGLDSYVNVDQKAPGTGVGTLMSIGAGGGGGAGTGAAVGGGGTSGGLGSQTSLLLGATFFSVVGGTGGSAGGAVAGGNGVSVAFQTTGSPIGAATGGGGTTSADFAGGLITAIASSTLSDYRPSVATGSVGGSGGVVIDKPFYVFGGMGGGASNAGVGGGGGNGIYGSGGGGGGGGTTGGAGGAGGAGLVMIISW